MSLTLRFPLNATVDTGYDSSGAAVNLSNSAVTTYGDAAYGDVAYFDGMALLEYANAPATAFGTNSRCYSFWVNPLGSSETLFSTGLDDGNGGLFRVSLTASREVKVEYSGLPDSITTSTLGLGVWSQVVVSYDGSTVSCFINSALALTDARDLDTEQSVLTIGDGFDGYMSDFRLFNNSLAAEDVTDLYQRGPNELLNANRTELVVFGRDGIETDIVSNDGVVAVGNVTARDISLVSEKAQSGDTQLQSSVYLHDGTTSERVQISQQVHAVDGDDAACAVSLNLSRANGGDSRSMQTCVQYSGESVGIHAMSSTGEAITSNITFDGLAFDSDDAAVVLGPFSEFRMRYDDVTDTLQIQHLEGGVYKTKVEYSR